MNLSFKMIFLPLVIDFLTSLTVLAFGELWFLVSVRKQCVVTMMSSGMVESRVCKVSTYFGTISGGRFCRPPLRAPLQTNVSLVRGTDGRHHVINRHPIESTTAEMFSGFLVIIDCSTTQIISKSVTETPLLP